MGKIGLIISREFSQRVRKKSFILITLLMPLLMVAFLVVPMLISMYGGDSKVREIVVVDQTSIVAPQMEDTDNLKFKISEVDYTSALVSNPSVFGFLVIDSNIVDDPSTLRFYTRESSTLGIEKDIRSQVSSIITSERIKRTGIEGLDSLISSVQARASMQTFDISEQGSEKASSSGASMGLAYVGGFMIYMFVFMYGMMVLQGVVEEKSSRIIEVIVSSVKPFELMMGKILGIAFVALLQFTLWVIIGVVLMALLPSMDGSSAGGMMGVIGSAGSVLDMWFIMKMIGSFVLFFIGGYLLYAAMFAAVGSAVDNVADTQQLQIPITVPLIVAIFAMMSVMQNPHSDVAFWFSIVPFTSPIIMMCRVAYGVPAWEFVLSVVLLYGSFVGMTYVAAKIYRIGIFMYGKKPSLKEIIKWARYKN